MLSISLKRSRRGPAWRNGTLRLATPPGKFALVGVVNTILDSVIFLLLVYMFDFNPVVSNSISYSCGIVNSFFLHQRWTFRSQPRPSGMVHRQFFLFTVLNLMGLGIATIIVWGLAEPLGPVAAKAIAIGGTFVWNYGTSRRFVFKG